MILTIVAGIIGIAVGLCLISGFFLNKEKKMKKAHEEKIKEIEKTYYDTTLKLIKNHDKHITEIAESSWNDGADYTTRLYEEPRR